MDFELPGEGDPRRAEVRRWLEKNPNPTPRQLLDSGYEVPHWPKPYGLGADPEFQLIVSQELDRAGVRRFGGLLSAVNLGPSLLTHGTQEAKERYLDKMLMGEERWAQMMSEPAAGSDLAALRTTAVRDGDEYVINGQKNWSNGGDAEFGMVIVRTDPHAAKHAGLSVLIVDLKAPGVTARLINNMNQDPSDMETRLYEVFFDNVRTPASNLVGQEGDGWRLTQQMLQSERMMILEAQNKPSAREMVTSMHAAGRLREPALQDEAAKIYIEGEMVRLLNLRAMSDQLNAKRPGPEAAAIKMIGAPHDQKLFDFVKRAQGQAGLVAGAEAFPQVEAPSGQLSWDACFWDSPTLTLRAGSQELMRNVISERVLGLPRELDPSAKGDWTENLKALGRAA